MNEKNENVGKIDDLVVGAESAHPVFAILQVGDFLGIGSRLVAVSFDSLKIDDNVRRVELPGASRDELKKLAEFQVCRLSLMRRSKRPSSDEADARTEPGEWTDHPTRSSIGREADMSDPDLLDSAR